MTRSALLSLLGPSPVLLLVGCAGIMDSETGETAASAQESDALDFEYDPASVLLGEGPDDDSDGFATSLDCDDTNPLINPAASETDNGVDDDCDDYIDEDFVSVGDLVITEVNRQSKFGGAVNVNGSWVEVQNTTTRTVDMSNWTIARYNSTSTTQIRIDPTAPVVILPGETAVFCDTDNYEGSAATWPLSCDYVWGDETQGAFYKGTYHDNTFYLRRDDDSFGIYILGSKTTGTLIDEVHWTYDATNGYWPRNARFSTSLDGDYIDATLNDEEDVWCSTSSSATGAVSNNSAWQWYDVPSSLYDEHGTPGADNYACLTLLDKDGDGYTSDTDCNDNNSGIYPGAAEVCDGIDQDCDGIIDDGTEGDGTIYYPDADSDTYGDPLSGITACALPPGYVLDDTDCDDTNGGSYPGGTEVCDGEDNDCDGTVDEDLTTGSNTFYADGDVDGYGDPADTTTACTAPAGYVADDTDCAPTDPEVSPGAAELDNLTDDDCDDYVDEDFISAGDLVITEINRQSRAGGTAANANASWVEIINDSTRAIDLSNMTLARGTSSSGKQIHIDPAEAPLLAPGDRAVFCDTNDYEADSGVAWPLDCDYVWGDETQPSTYVGTYHDNTFALVANADTFAIYTGGDRTTGSLIDQVTWTYDATSGYWPRVARFSMSLDPAAQDATLNDNIAAWCSTTQTSSGGVANDPAWVWYDVDTSTLDEHGTPGAANYDCVIDTDLDGDGYTGADDCDETDSEINAFADEICDGIDNDCDTLIDEDSTASATWYADTDGDSFGDGAVSLNACAQPVDYVADNTDCDDGNALSNPLASEICDGEDNDCDTLIDEDATDAPIWYADFDADTYGDPTSSIASCTQPDIYVADDTDCNDGATAINPAATEVCDGVDNDCDTEIDEIGSSGGSTYYADTDSDTYGDPASSVVACALPSGYSSDNTDCDDGSAVSYPGATELCDGLDNDCDTVVDDGAPLNTFYADVDNDGYGDPASTTSACSAPTGYVADNTDCAPSDGSVSPGATEICNDHFDQNCNSDPAECEWSGEDTAKAAYDMRFYGTTANWAVGTSIANNGDFNGDGYDDPVFGASFMENSTVSDNGAVYLYYGPVTTSDDITSYNVNIWGATTVGSDYFGSSVRYIADMDADGDDELLASAWKSGSTDTGTTYLFLGGTTPTSVSSAFASFTTTDANAYMGQAIDGNDVDGDGKPEVIVGAYNRTSGTGALGLWNGAGISGAEDLATTSTALFTGSVANDNFGYAAMFVEDLDGDGVDDLVVGAPAASSSTIKGHAYIWYNAETLSGAKASSTADATITGSAAGDRFGLAIASLGDTDNDGQNELMVTADKNDGSATDAGAAYIWDSAPSGASVAVTSASSTIRGEFTSDFFGRTGAGLGDINDDGYDDFMVGATAYDDATLGSGCGAAYLWYGPAPTGTVSAGGFDALFTGANTSDAVGYAMAGGGDVNGDTYQDFMLAATSWDSFGLLNAGGAWVYYGRSE